MAKRKTIYEQMEEDKEALNQAIEAEQAKPEEELPPEEPQVEEEQEKEDEGEKEPAPKQEVKPEDKEALLKAQFEAREAKRKALELEERLKALETVKAEPPKKDEDPEPSPEEEPIAHLQWQVRQSNKRSEEVAKKLGVYEQERQQAAAEAARENYFSQLESQMRPQLPDYEDVANHLVKQIAHNASMVSPMATPQQIGNFVKEQILTLADHYERQGINPVQALYELSKTHYGYQPKTVEEKPLKPDIEKVAQNQKRSATGFGSGSSGRANVTLEHAAKMTVAELQALDPSERMALGIQIH